MGNLLGINKDKTNEVISVNAQEVIGKCSHNPLDLVKIEDFVLSKTELNQIHIPLAKDFWFKEVEEHNIEKCFIFKGKSKVNKSSAVSVDKNSGSCCLSCSIF